MGNAIQSQSALRNLFIQLLETLLRMGLLFVGVCTFVIYACVDKLQSFEGIIEVVKFWVGKFKLFIKISRARIYRKSKILYYFLYVR